MVITVVVVVVCVRERGVWGRVEGSRGEVSCDQYSFVGSFLPCVLGPNA